MPADSISLPISALTDAVAQRMVDDPQLADRLIMKLGLRSRPWKVAKCAEHMGCAPSTFREHYAPLLTPCRNTPVTSYPAGDVIALTDPHK